MPVFGQLVINHQLMTERFDLVCTVANIAIKCFHVNVIKVVIQNEYATIEWFFLVENFHFVAQAGVVREVPD